MQFFIIHIINFIIQVPRSSEVPGKGAFWALHPDAHNMFENGCYLRRQKRFKCSAKKSSNSTGDLEKPAKASKRKSVTVTDNTGPKPKRRNSVNTSATDSALESSPGGSDTQISRIQVPIESPPKRQNSEQSQYIKQEATFTPEVTEVKTCSPTVSAQMSLPVNQFAGLAGYLPLPISSTSEIPSYSTTIESYPWNSWNSGLQATNIGLGLYPSHFGSVTQFEPADAPHLTQTLATD